MLSVFLSAPLLRHPDQSLTLILKAILIHKLTLHLAAKGAPGISLGKDLSLPSIMPVLSVLKQETGAKVLSESLGLIDGLTVAGTGSSCRLCPLIV
jgi:hypothetical protein